MYHVQLGGEKRAPKKGDRGKRPREVGTAEAEIQGWASKALTFKSRNFLFLSIHKHSLVAELQDQMF